MPIYNPPPRGGGLEPHGSTHTIDGSDPITGILDVGITQAAWALAGYMVNCGRNWDGVVGGEIGDGTTVNRPNLTQIGSCTWRALDGAISPAGHCLGIRGDGLLFAWGRNTLGELGDGTTTNRLSPTQIGSCTWKAISAGGQFSLGIRADGLLFAWGSNLYGQLGDGTTTDRRTPTQIGTCTWKAISAGGRHSLGIRADDLLFVWGSNLHGQLGDGTTTNRLTPTQLGTCTWKAVAAGYYHSLAIRGDGLLFAWGENKYGQLGDGTTTDRLTPTQIGTCTWKAVATGGYYHDGYNVPSFCLGIRGDGLLFAWGDNTYGQLGDGTTTQRLTPTQIGSCTWKAIAAGARHSVGIDGAGLRFAWGENTYGQLGDGTTTQRLTPTQTGVRTFTLVASGPFTSLGIAQ